MLLPLSCSGPSGSAASPFRRASTGSTAALPRDRRAPPGRDLDERDDILSMLVAARHEDGSPMSDDEMRDELLTLLVAGHETTATSLAWAVERLVRHPEKLERLRSEAEAGRRGLPDGDDPGDASPAAGGRAGS
jgi:cytochrome P450